MMIYRIRKSRAVYAGDWQSAAKIPVVLGARSGIAQVLHVQDLSAKGPQHLLDKWILLGLFSQLLLLAPLGLFARHRRRLVLLRILQHQSQAHFALADFLTRIADDLNVIGPSQRVSRMSRLRSELEIELSVFDARHAGRIDRRDQQALAPRLQRILDAIDI